MTGDTTPRDIKRPDDIPDLSRDMTPRGHTLSQKERRALEMRAARMPYEQIAAELGYANGAGAHKAVQRGLAKTLQESADELRALECESLDQLYRQALAIVLGQGMTPSIRLQAIDRCIRLKERKATMLGIDAPVRRVVDFITRDAFLEVAGEVEAEYRELQAILADAETAGEWAAEGDGA